MLIILFTNVALPLKVGPAIRIVVGCRNLITHAISPSRIDGILINLDTLGVFILTLCSQHFFVVLFLNDPRSLELVISFFSFGLGPMLFPII